MTEDEAKTKQCLLIPARGQNRTYSNGRLREEYQCIGSQCMAWRATDNEIKENPDGPIEDGKAMKASDYVSAGYCGLAGK